MWEFRMREVTGILILLIATLCGSALFAQEAQQYLEPAKNILSPQELSAYEQRAMGKVKDFTNYLELITNKKYDKAVRLHSLQPATSLFSSPQKFMEVASTSNKLIRKYPIQSYLRKILNTSYQQIRISHENMRWLEPLHRMNNGSYEGTIVCEQRFIGVYTDGREYSDFTTKAYEVVLKKKSKDFGSRTLNVWQLYLGDVKIESITNTDRSLQIQVEKTSNNGITSGISTSRLEQALEQGNQRLAAKTKAESYLEHSSELVKEWNRSIRMQLTPSAQLSHELKPSRYGDKAENLKLTLQIRHNPFGLGNATSLQYDQSKSYYNIYLKDFLSAFAVLVQNYSNLNTSTEVTGKYTGHASTNQNLSFSTYQGELGRIEDVGYFSENKGSFEGITIENGQKITSENLALLRALMVSQSLQNVVKGDVDFKVNFNDSEEDYTRIVTVEVLLKNAYATWWESLSTEAQNEIMNQLN